MAMVLYHSNRNPKIGQLCGLFGLKTCGFSSAVAEQSAMISKITRITEALLGSAEATRSAVIKKKTAALW